jgi:hydroxyacylglutathione hydrolase
VEPHNTGLLQRLTAAEHIRADDQPTVPSTLADELATNPFLRCHIDEVRAAAEEFSGRRLPEAAEVFAAVRSWKDGWRG